MSRSYEKGTTTLQFLFNYYLSDSIHLIVQDQSETMEFMLITNKRLTL